MLRRIWVLPLLICGVSTPVLAQDAGSLLRDRQNSQQIPLPPPPPDAELKLEPPATAESQPGQTVHISKVEFRGQPELLSEAQRAQLAATIEGTEASFASLRALADAANTALRQNGALLARAIIPPQDATGGLLVVEILDGKLEDISFEPKAGVRIHNGVLQAIANRQLDRGALTKADLEAALLRMNDLPGVSVQSRLAPGTTAGTSRLIVDVSEGPVVSGALHADNFGSPSTGRAQGHAQLILSDMTGLGDLSQLGLSVSEGQRYASATVALPLSASGLGVSFNYGYLSYENVDPVGQTVGLEGHAHFGSLALQYQAIRTRDANLRLSLAVNGKALTDDANAGRLADKRTISGTLGLTGDVRDAVLGGGVTQLNLSWTFGDLDLSRVPSAEFFDALGLRTQGGFHRVNADLVRLQRLSGPLSLFARLSGQWASKNLDSSESFSLGGPYGVRGWPIGEGRGDMGLTGTMELRYDAALPDNLGAVRLTAFLDAGRVWINERSFGIPAINACGCNDYSLASAGLGLLWQRDNFNVSVSWAHGLGRNPGRDAITGTNVDGHSRRQQFWLTGSIRF